MPGASAGHRAPAPPTRRGRLPRWGQRRDGSEAAARDVPGRPAVDYTSRSRRHPAEPSRVVEARRSLAGARTPAHPCRSRSGRSRPRHRRVGVGRAILRGTRKAIPAPRSRAATRCRGDWRARPAPGPGRHCLPSRPSGPRRGPRAGRRNRARPPAEASSRRVWVDGSGGAKPPRMARARGAGARRSAALVLASPVLGDGCLTASLKGFS
jgi:hypothetical protein